MIIILLAGIALTLTGAFVAWVRSVRHSGHGGRPTPLQLAIGFVFLFFDTLGIGNYAPTTAAFRFFRMMPDEQIPGTLNLGSALPVALEAFAFITVVTVAPLTLWTTVLAAAIGGWLGARIISKLPRRPIQWGMGAALLVGAGVMALTGLKLIPGGGVATSLSGPVLVFAVASNFVLGMLCALGIGNYAPSLILLSLLGMDPRAAFPIMMGSAAYILPASGWKYAQTERYNHRAALGLAIGGVPGVLIAAYIVKTLPLDMLRWLVVVVVLVAAVGLLRAAYTGSGGDALVESPAAIAG